MQCLRAWRRLRFSHAGFIFGTAALAQTDAEATGKTVDKTEHKIDDDTGWSLRLPGLGSECFPTIMVSARV